jgi:hypothetical protein
VLFPAMAKNLKLNNYVKINLSAKLYLPMKQGARWAV